MNKYQADDAEPTEVTYKPRKQPKLWQAYLWFEELKTMKQRHILRLSACEGERSNMSAQMEKDILEAFHFDEQIAAAEKVMISEGRKAGQIWNWLAHIKGLKSGSLTARLVAQIDDIGKFDSVSKLWRFAGMAVIDGAAEKRKKGEITHYNSRLKGVLFLIAEQFVRQQTPLYSDIYYAEKQRLRVLHPEPVAVPGKKFHDYTDGHIDTMARRKMLKIFLQHLWVTWREYEGLPISKPYVEAILGHIDIIPAPRFEEMEND